MARPLSQMCFLSLLLTADFRVLKISKHWKFVLLDQFTRLEKNPLVFSYKLSVSVHRIFNEFVRIWEVYHLIDQTCKITDASTISLVICKHKKWNL